MAKSSPMIERYARVGAESRLTELKAEISEIERAFPGIGRDAAPARRGPGRPRAQTADQGEPAPAPRKRRTRKPMTAAQKEAVGERMKKYWTERRKTDAGKKR